MKKKVFALSLICAGLFTLLLLTVLTAKPASAQGTPPPEKCGCKECHEQQYYVYDTGKSFCLCEEPMTCVHCHGGDGKAKTADLAHTGMRLHPFENNALACQECHKEETQAHVDEFVARAGAGPTPIALKDQPPFHAAAPLAFPESEPRTLGPWEWFSVVLMSAITLWVLFLLLRR